MSERKPRQLDQQLPHNLKVERALLGAIFLRNDTLFDVSEIVLKDDFFEPAHGEIFILLKDHIEANRRATPTSLLADMAQDADIGGVRASVYLARLYEEGLDRDEAIEAAKVTRDNAIRRRLIQVANDVIIEAHSAPVSTPAEVIRDKFVETVDALFPTIRDAGILTMFEYGERVISRSAEAYKRGRQYGLDWGLAGVQDLIGVLLPGRVVVIPGASGSGKSVLAQQVLEHVCREAERKEDQKWGFWVQAEMEGEEVAVRGLAGETGISGYEIERGNISAAEAQSVFDANQKKQGQGVLVWAAPFPTMQRVRSLAVRLKRRGQLDLMVIDHLFYIEKPERGMSEIEAIGPNLRAIKGLAKELGIPIIVLMPLRATYAEDVAKVNVRRPYLGDVPNNGQVIANADAIVFVHRPEYILRQNEPPKSDEKKRGDWEAALGVWTGRAEFIKVKQRGGDSGSWSKRVWFGDGQRVKFFDNEPPRHFERVPGFDDYGGLPLSIANR